MSTQLQVDLAKLAETERSNRAKEQETERSNKERERLEGIRVQPFEHQNYLNQLERDAMKAKFTNPATGQETSGEALYAAKVQAGLRQSANQAMAEARAVEDTTTDIYGNKVAETRAETAKNRWEAFLNSSGINPFLNTLKRISG